MLKKKNSLMLLITGLLVTFFCGLKNVDAETQPLTIVHTGWWWNYSYNGTYKSWKYTFYEFSGKIAYCINPQVDEGPEYFTGDWSYSNLPNEKKERMLLLAYYGYDFPGHQQDGYRVATQALLWEEAGATPVRFTSERYEQGTTLNIENERNEILRLVNNHYVKPSFNNTEINMNVDQTVTLTDTNNVLGNYEVFESNGADISIHGNNLTIKANKAGKISLKFRKKQHLVSAYIVYYNGDAQRMLSAGAVDPVYSSLNLNVTNPQARIKVKKIDADTNSCKAQGSATLKGAKYKVVNSKGVQVDTITIGDDCTGVSKLLPYDTYTISEISSSKGYQIDPNTYTATINSTVNVNVTSKEKVIEARIKVKKIDADTNSCKAQGSATLKGAKYKVVNSKGVQVDTITIGDDCTGVSKLLPYDTYTISEISSSKGYQIDPNTYTATINSTVNVNVISKEKVITNFISILKQYDVVDGNSTILNAEANITFEIYDQDKIKFGEITTDKNGYALIEIPYGIWTFHQVNAENGFSKIHDFNIIVDETSEKTQYYNVLNNKLTAYLQVIKIDSETGKKIALANTTFKILNIDTNKYVSQFVAGKVYDTFSTDETGIMTTYLKLESGNYRLIEISSPDGYLLSTTGLDFSIGDNSDFIYTNYGPIIKIEFPNSPIKGKVEVYKYGEIPLIENNKYVYKKVNLKGVEFMIYAYEDILSSDKQHLYYNKGELVDFIVTDEHGYAISRELPLGTYILVESKALPGYMIDNEVYIFTLSAKYNNVPIVYKRYDLYNYLIKGKLEFTKTDTNGIAIPNTKVDVYHIIDDMTSELIFSDYTDENGKIFLSDLFVGKFKIVESEPAYSFKLNEEPIFFEITENDKVIKKSMINEKLTSKIRIHKVDENGVPLSGVKVGVFDLKDNLIGTYITDANGIIEIDLEYGSYYYSELESLENFELNNEKIYFDIINDEEIIESTLINHSKKIKVPNTGKGIELICVLGGLAILSSFGLFIYGIKRKEK